jgi:hypothetical protein
VRTAALACATVAGLVAAIAAADKIDRSRLLTGQAAYIDYRAMKPGVFRKITANDLPKPLATPSVRNQPQLVARPSDAWPQAPAGFKVDLYADGLTGPRQIRARSGLRPTATSSSSRARPVR